MYMPRTGGQKIDDELGILGAVGVSKCSAKRMWLQKLTEDNSTTCGPIVDYLCDVFPALEVITMLIRGDGNCAKVQWELLGVSMPGWVLLMFVAMAGAGILRLLRKD